MLTPSRRHRALSQALAALLLITGWAAPLAVPHSWGDDPICLVAGSGGTPDTARVGSVGFSPAQPDHCVVCHTARSFRSAPISGGRVTASTTAGPILETPADDMLRAPALDRLPARAPPA